jgi:uncharacterized protein
MRKAAAIAPVPGGFMERAAEQFGDVGTGIFIGEDGRLRLGIRLALGFLVAVAGLQMASVAGQLSVQAYPGMPWLGRQAAQAAVMTGIVVPLVYVLRVHVDRRSLAAIGLGQPASSIRFFLLGFGGVATVLAVPLALISVFGWGRVTVDTSAGMLSYMAAWLVIAFFFEAFPEEVVVRGYLYRNLSAVLARWAASLATLALFVMIPVALHLFGTWVLGSATTLGGQQGITFGYLAVITLFGLGTQYLRVVTGSVWTGIGLHLGLLQLGRMFGPDEGAFIRIEAFRPGAVDNTIHIALLIGVILLISLPWLTRRRVGWRERDPE